MMRTRIFLDSIPDNRATDVVAVVVTDPWGLVSGRWARLACERHLRYLERQGTEGFPQRKGRRIAR